MKRLMAVLAVVSPLFGGFAADYFNVGTKKDNYVTTAVWAPVDQTAQDPKPLEKPSKGNTYWIVDGSYQAGTNTSYATGWFVNSKDQTMPGTLCVGSPTGHPIFGQRGGTLRKGGGSKASMKATINWYNGTLYKAGYYPNTYLSTGVINVLDGGADSVHEIYNNVQTSEHSMQHAFACPFVCEDPSIDISITCGGKGSEETAVGHVSYVQFSGDNSQYKGSFSLGTAYFSLALEGTEPLGDPNTPNPAALTVCDKGVISCSAASQSASRGIRFKGESAYLLSMGAGIQTVRYPISRAENALGNLIKIGDGTNTLACAWAAGDIEVKTGTLILDADAAFPVGQKFKVDDGATLMFTTVIDDVEVTVEGSGQVIYPEGWRLNADNEWEVKVSLTTEGEGTVTGSHLTDDSWTLLGSDVTLTATSGAGAAFLHWSGDLTLIPGGRAMTSPVTVKADAPRALCAHFGVLEKPADVTDADGTTYVFADRALTVTVPDGKTNAYDYVSAVTSGYVTNIVKKGAGQLELKSADYYGDWDVVEGVIRLGVVGGLGADDCGAVNVRSGAALWGTVNSTCSRGKHYTFAGTGDSGSVGAYRNMIKSNSALLQISGSMALAADATFRSPSALRLEYSSIDMAGHTLTIKGEASYANLYLQYCTVTNSSASASILNLTTSYGKYNLGDNIWGGVAQNNTVQVGNNHRVHLSGRNEGDWTMKATSLTMHIAGAVASKDGSPVLTTTWEGPFNANGKTIYVASEEIGPNGFVTFGGPVIGSGTMSVYGGCIWLSDANTFSGTISISHPASQRHSKIRPGLWLGEGANYSCGSGETLSISEGDLHLADGSEYAIPSITLADDAGIYGGVKLTVGALNGFPAYAVGGTQNLTVTGAWTVPMAEVNAGGCLTMDSGSLTFANGSALTVTKESGEKLTEGVVIASAPGGIVGLPKSRYQTELSADGTSLALKSKGIVLIVR